MNEQLKDFAIEQIKAGLAKLSEGHHHLFKQMYANGNLDTPINEVVDNMPDDKLDWAMQQIQNTLKKGVSDGY